ncbi:hypothetical protein B0H15DRAFT_803829 [Mycena belliarum]|uniref:Uncharacterized protein n=1 Tax=Mycena belliarum TaxID=1033014 RepID=A0AAD6TVJ5_9AGAR|nr:hypothetical protein B0H15DRAFT_803829 [Mycena belliae]
MQARMPRALEGRDFGPAGGPKPPKRAGPQALARLLQVPVFTVQQLERSASPPCRPQPRRATILPPWGAQNPKNELGPRRQRGRVHRESDVTHGSIHSGTQWIHPPRWIRPGRWYTTTYETSLGPSSTREELQEKSDFGGNSG